MNQTQGYGPAIVFYRKKLCLSQIELSKLVGMCQPSLSKIENGIVGVSVKTLRKLATTLQVDVHALCDKTVGEYKTDPRSAAELETLRNVRDRAAEALKELSQRFQIFGFEKQASVMDPAADMWKPLRTALGMKPHEEII